MAKLGKSNLLKDIEDAIAKRSTGLISFEQDIPKILYHYTKSAGFMGIFETGTIWATYYRMLNDSSELEYGMGVLRNLLIEMEENTGKRDYKRLGIIRTIMASANWHHGNEQKYVACFCEDGNNLNQWRVYTGGEAGMSIGFDTESILSKCKSEAGRFEIAKVIYDEVEQKRIIKFLIEYSVDIIESALRPKKLNADSTEGLNTIAKFIWPSIANCLIRFKHPAFAVEKEWRIYQMTELNHSRHSLVPKYRASKNGLIPYTEIDLANEDSSGRIKLPVKTLYFSAITDPQNTGYVLMEYLKSKSYRDIRIIDSGLPIRK